MKFTPAQHAVIDALLDAPTELEIPDAAYAAGERVATRWPIAASDALDLASELLQAAAPLAVAAELRRIADMLDARREEIRQEDNRSTRSSGLGEGIRLIRERADELERLTREGES